MVSREEALSIVHQFVKSPNLRRHMIAVEGAMRYYAKMLGQSEEIWGLAGLLHDFDYEIHPTLEEHPKKGVPILKNKGIPEEVIRAILAHNYKGTGVYPENLIDYALIACDEITGFIIAAVLVRPDKDLEKVKIKSLKKKWKDKSFARGVNRKEVEESWEAFKKKAELDFDFWKHIENVKEGMLLMKKELEF